jgi:hypothetical protein
MLIAALGCLMLYRFELMATPALNRGLASPIKEPNVLSATSVKQRQFCCVSYEQKWGRKNGPTRSGTLRQANAKAYAAAK